jgi:hypothetical protein
MSEHFQWLTMSTESVCYYTEYVKSEYRRVKSNVTLMSDTTLLTPKQSVRSHNQTLPPQNGRSNMSLIIHYSPPMMSC